MSHVCPFVNLHRCSDQSGKVQLTMKLALMLGLSLVLLAAVFVLPEAIVGESAYAKWRMLPHSRVLTMSKHDGPVSFAGMLRHMSFGRLGDNKANLPRVLPLSVRTLAYENFRDNMTMLPAWVPHGSVHNRKLCLPKQPLWPGSLQFYRDDSLVYEPAACNMFRISARQARQCLVGRHVFFVGDSLTRYQYVSLAHFIGRLEYPDQFAGEPSRPSVCIEREWDSWDSFYSNGAEILGATRGAAGKEHIDADHEASRENRILVMKNILGHPDTEIKLEMRVFVNKEPDGLLSVFDALQTRLLEDSLVPDVVVMNTGIWGSGDLEAVYHRGEQMMRASKGRIQFVWKTTTITRSWENADVVERELDVFARKGSRWELLDAFSISRAYVSSGLDLYWDNYHFLPAGYEFMNDVLLSQLCQERLP